MWWMWWMWWMSLLHQCPLFGICSETFCTFFWTLLTFSPLYGVLKLSSLRTFSPLFLEFCLVWSNSPYSISVNLVYVCVNLNTLAEPLLWRTQTPSPEQHSYTWNGKVYGNGEFESKGTYFPSMGLQVFKTMIPVSPSWPGRLLPSSCPIHLAHLAGIYLFRLLHFWLRLF